MNCNHPGCNELLGNDDGAAYYSHLSRGEAFREVMRQADAEQRPAMKVALLSLAESITRGEGARDAFRLIRVASNHS